MIVSTIIRAKDRFGNIVIVDHGSSIKTIELAEVLNVEVLKAKDKMDAILLGFKKAREMKLKPIMVLEKNLENNEKILVESLGIDIVKLNEFFPRKHDNYRRIVLGYDPKDPTSIGVKVFYVLWKFYYSIGLLLKYKLKYK